MKGEQSSVESWSWCNHVALLSLLLTSSLLWLLGVGRWSAWPWVLLERRAAPPHSSSCKAHTIQTEGQSARNISNHFRESYMLLSIWNVRKRLDSADSSRCFGVRSDAIQFSCDLHFMQPRVHNEGLLPHEYQPTHVFGSLARCCADAGLVRPCEWVRVVDFLYRHHVEYFCEHNISKIVR